MKFTFTEEKKTKKKAKKKAKKKTKSEPEVCYYCGAIDSMGWDCGATPEQSWSWCLDCGGM